MGKFRDFILSYGSTIAAILIVLTALIAFRLITTDTTYEIYETNYIITAEYSNCYYNCSPTDGYVNSSINNCRVTNCIPLLEEILLPATEVIDICVGNYTCEQDPECCIQNIIDNNSSKQVNNFLNNYCSNIGPKLINSSYAAKNIYNCNDRYYIEVINGNL